MYIAALMMMQEGKVPYHICRKCKNPKEVSQFEKQSTGVYSSVCNECRTQMATANKRRHDLKNPEEARCRRTYRYALEKKRIIRQPCAICGSTDSIEGHHEDYSKPLDVIWLCREHHLEIHNGEKGDG